MDVVARAMALVIVAVPPQMKQIELVNQAVALEQVNRAIDGDARNVLINAQGAIEDFVGVEMAASSFHHLKQHAALLREADTAGPEFPLEAAGRLVNVDALAGGNAMCRSSSHTHSPRNYSKSPAPGCGIGASASRRALVRLNEAQDVAIHHEGE